MSVVAVVVFLVAYVLIASDRVNKTLVALAGAAIVVDLAGDQILTTCSTPARPESIGT